MNATKRPTKKEIDKQVEGMDWNAARIVYLNWWLSDPKLAKKHDRLRAELEIYTNAGDKTWPVIAAELTASRNLFKKNGERK